MNAVAIHVVSVDGEEEYLYEFSFAPEKPIDPEYRQAYAEAQRKWLEEWKPYEWHFIQ